jgi:hypothetical protein
MRANTTGIADPDKDDLNIIYNRGRFVDMQIVWQPWKLRYCDNGGCFRRRTVSAKTSADGVSWDADRPLITPDDQASMPSSSPRIRLQPHSLDTWLDRLRTHRAHSHRYPFTNTNTNTHTHTHTHTHAHTHAHTHTNTHLPARRSRAHTHSLAYVATSANTSRIPHHCSSIASVRFTLATRRESQRTRCSTPQRHHSTCSGGSTADSLRLAPMATLQRATARTCTKNGGLVRRAVIQRTRRGGGDRTAALARPRVTHF